MTLGSLLLYGLAILTVMAAGFAVAIARDERSRARWLLATSVGLAGVLALVGAVPLSLVLLFVAAGQALVTLYAVSVVQSLDRSSQESPGRRAAAASHWLSIVLGIGGGLYLASAIGRALGDGLGGFTLGAEIVTTSAAPDPQGPDFLAAGAP